MAEEPTLPLLPPMRPSFAESRKRSRRALDSPASFSTSSDPAVFSSDDDPGLDNYVHGRRKKRYVGTWFDQQQMVSSDSVDSAFEEETPRPLPKPRQRHYKRQLDSGVWMGQGDATDTDDGIELEPSIPKLPLNRPMAPPPARRLNYTPAELDAQKWIQRCIDEGEEVVDLHGLGLESISDQVIERIDQITPIPNVARDVAFEQRDPEIKLLMSVNMLNRFPGAVLRLEHLTVLTLRDNRLTELPPALGSLTNLQALNVAQNRLRYLPAELLLLMRKGSKLTNLAIHPNPFFEPESRDTSARRGSIGYERATFPLLEEATLAAGTTWEGYATALESRTPVQFSNSFGTIISRFSIPGLDGHLPPANRLLEVEAFSELEMHKNIEFRLGEQGAPASKFTPVGAPSLFELALRTAVQEPDSHRTKELLRDCPHLLKAFERALRIHELGRQSCPVCRRQIVNPMAEWIEFRVIRQETTRAVAATEEGEGAVHEIRSPWAAGANDALVPFLRKGCSWSCIPVKVPV